MEEEDGGIRRGWGKGKGETIRISGSTYAASSKSHEDLSAGWHISNEAACHKLMKSEFSDSVLSDSARISHGAVVY